VLTLKAYISSTCWSGESVIVQSFTFAIIMYFFLKLLIDVPPPQLSHMIIASLTNVIVFFPSLLQTLLVSVLETAMLILFYFQGMWRDWSTRTRNEEHNGEEHNKPTTTHTCIRGTAYASVTSESSNFLIRHIFKTWLWQCWLKHLVHFKTLKNS
jgi:hypothetical protein